VADPVVLVGVGEVKEVVVTTRLATGAVAVWVLDVEEDDVVVVMVIATFVLIVDSSLIGSGVEAGVELSLLVKV